MPLSFQDKITPIVQAPTSSGLSFANKITPIISAKETLNPPFIPSIGENYRVGKINALDVATQSFGKAAGEINTELNRPFVPIMPGGVGILPNPIGLATTVIGGIANLIGGGISAIEDPVATAIGRSIRQAIGPEKADALKAQLAQAFNHPLVQSAIKAYSSPQVMGNLSAVGNIAQLAGTIVGTKTVLESLPALRTAAEIKLSKISTQQSLKDWQKPTIVNEPKYRKATDIYKRSAEKGHDISETLVKNKIQLSENVNNGNYATEDAANNIRNDAGKLSSETLRPSLQLADQHTPKTSVKDVIKSTIRDVKNSRGVTPGDIESQIAKIKIEGGALSRKYPNGMSLTDMHDSKITYTSNAKYSPVGDTNVNNNAGVNRAFGRVLGGLVESKAPPEIPVKAFNAELAKQYQAADYLDALNNKKVPISIISRILKTTSKVAGAAIGHGVGGGILGGVGGYHIGGMLETMVERTPNPVKRYFLNNLQGTNPEAFNAVKNYLVLKKLKRIRFVNIKNKKLIK